MKIKRKTRNINKYLRHIKQGEPYFLGLPVEINHFEMLEKLGFSLPLTQGERVLPAVFFGPACRRNADGYDIVHRDQTKETAYRQSEWKWKEFRGRHDTVERSKIVEVPYKRYPRTYITPYAIELETKQSEAGELLVVAGPFINGESDTDKATNTANVFIELFKESLVFNQALAIWNKVPLHRLNWELLPPGENPWESAKTRLKKIIQQTDKGNQPVIQKRYDAIGLHDPEFVAEGKGGFNGYVVFGFPSSGFCILESNSVNNATYVLNDGDWESVSRLTKAEILNAKAHKARLVHRENWFKELNSFIGSSS
jgi:hypothetical protein